MKQVRWNLIWAAGYNVFAVGLAMGAGSWCGVVLTPEISGELLSKTSFEYLTSLDIIRNSRMDVG